MLEVNTTDMGRPVLLSRYFWYLFCLIVLLSFFFLSPWGSPILNSDGAIEVLMAYWYRLPNDLYYWGQDRGGSLVPMLASFPVQRFGVDPLLAVSVVRYLLMIVGIFGGYFRLLKEARLRFIFCIAFFLPAFHFSDLTWYTIGIEYSLIGIQLALYRGLLEVVQDGKRMTTVGLLVGILIMNLVTLWVSDAALLPLLLLVLFFLVHSFAYRSEKPFALMFILLGGLAAVVLLVGWMKSFAAVRMPGYTAFNGPTEIASAFGQFRISVFQYLGFQLGDPLLSLTSWAWLILLGYVLALLFIHRPRKKTLLSFQFFFLINAFLLVLMLFCSRWVLINGVSRRYFIGVYLSLTLSVLLWLQDAASLPALRRRRIVRIAFFTVLLGAFSTFYHFIRVDPGSLRSMRSVVKAIPVDSGIIGSYWNSYIFSMNNPGRIIATPHEQELVRNKTLALEVFRQPRLLLVRDQWMEKFPDTLMQFGKRLRKSGNERFLAGAYFCEYRIY
ncbi:MAG: hypothetical protein KBA16_01005 [Bacteroidia bacterium]|jgi:hypothetical protein|nr:hypothetical protein [Bacteroidia bacterium]MBP7436269.1 hypothetical protein [Bacteroidia bacterium]MBP7728160.1 hypothetical protein [Bacteroidia bacterium]MBP7771341.1 hypothetical protein [Bacteroidia bacterium]